MMPTDPFSDSGQRLFAGAAHTEPIDRADPTVERLHQTLFALYTQEQAPAELRRTGARQIRQRYATQLQERRVTTRQRRLGLPTWIGWRLASAAGMHAAETTSGQLSSAPPDAHAGHMPRRTRAIPALGITLAFIAITVALFGAFNAHRHGPLSGASSSPTAVATGCQPGQITAQMPLHTRLFDLATPAPDEGWAVGAIDNANGVGYSTSLLLHFRHCVWTPEGPSYAGMTLTNLAMVSPQDGWASGYSITSGEDNTQLLLRYSGGQWRRVALPAALGGLGAITNLKMLSGNEGWLVLTRYGGPSQQATATDSLVHYVNGAWTVVAAPYPQIADLAPVAPNDLWIAWNTCSAQNQPSATTGDNTCTPAAANQPLSSDQPAYYGPAYLGHDQAGRWTTTAAPAGAWVGTFQMDSPSDGWLMSELQSPTDPSFSGVSTLIMHYDGATWTAVTIRADPRAQFVHMFTDSDGWAVAIANRQVPNMPNTSEWAASLVQHYTHGQWRTTPWPFTDVLHLVIHRLSDDEAWATGDVVETTPASGPGTETAVLLHYVAGTWHEYGR